jgi:hypothetical protein
VKNQHLLCCALFAAATVAGNAAVLDFEDLAHEDELVVDHGPTYSRHGYVLTNTATEEESGFPPSFATFGTLHPSFTGSTALFNDNFAGTTVLRRSDAGIFNLVSIGLAELTPSEETFEVLFSGQTASGMTVIQNFLLDGDFGGESVTFGPEFQNLVSVNWTQTPLFHQFDDISVNEVPEPTTVCLLGGGLLALAGARKRAGRLPKSGTRY